MKKNSYNFSEFDFSSKIIRDLASENKNVSQFISSFFSIESIKKQLVEKEILSENRLILQETLNRQNSSINLTASSQSNINSLNQDNAFTITTGHQLNLLTGPIYSIYKIVQVILWTQKLNIEFPNSHFVPMFWMATEDHDFEEINHIHLFDTKIEWHKKGQNSFVTGKIETNNFNDFENEILEKFSDDNIKLKISNYLSFYKTTDLATASRALINDLFGDYGLVIMDGDDKALKQLFSPIVKKEIEENITFKEVSKVNLKLEETGYHSQVYVRACNLFYIENKTVRHRIIATENGFEINSNPYSKTELLALVDEFPERFSPNALMRPLYQETILPNIMYLGGGGEIAYWLQLKGLFDKLNLKFPLLRVRDSYILLTEKQINQIDELNYSIVDLKQNIDDLIKNHTKANSTTDISMTNENEIFNDLKLKLNLKVENKDLGIQRFIEGELVKIENQLKKIEKKLIQNEKKKLEQSIKRIQKLKEKIFPKNGFQERYENILQYTSNNNLIDTIKKEAEQSLTVRPQIKIFKL